MFYATIARIIAGFFGYTVDHLTGMVYGMILSDIVSATLHYGRRFFFSNYYRHHRDEHPVIAFDNCPICQPRN